MLRNDGAYVIYKIQHRIGSLSHNRGHAPKTNDNDWDYSNLDHFGTPIESFSAAGDCWQTTGTHGTFEVSDLPHALKNIRASHPGVHFRATRVDIQQVTMVLSE